MKYFIAFGNQKGGSGKSTLCALFASYLVEKGLHVFLADFDAQASVASTRQADLKMFPDVPVPYQVQSFAMSLPGRTDRENEIYIIGTLNFLAEKADVVLVDTPGNILEDNLLLIYQKMDYVIVPFGYDRVSWNALVAYINTLGTIKMEFGYHFSPIYFLNKYDRRKGTSQEHEYWEALDRYLSKTGTLAPPVFDRAEMSRFNTLVMSKKQQENVAPCFDFIYHAIFENKSHHE